MTPNETTSELPRQLAPMAVGRVREDWERLVQSSLAGDEHARGELVAGMALVVRAYYRRRGLSRADAEELAVSTVSDVVLTLGSYESAEGRSFLRWLYGVCRKKRADEFRRRYRGGEQSLAEMQPSARVIADSPPESLSIAREALEDALSQLSREDRHLVAARHAREPVEFRQLASELGLDAALCRKRFERAMKKLRQWLYHDPRTVSLRNRPIDDGHDALGRAGRGQ